MINVKLNVEIEKSISFFPTTRYQGSKRRLLPWFYKIFKDITFESVLDGCGGSASVSYLFKLMGKEVHYNDILLSNYQTGLALIENNDVVLSSNDVEFILAKNDSQIPTFIKDTFDGIYYYPDENIWLDMVVNNIGKLSNIYSGDILVKKRALAYNALFQACLTKRPYNLFHRKNLYMREANVPRSFGNKKTWDTPFPNLFSRFVLETSSKVFSNNKENRATCDDLMMLKNNNYDLVYLDPPYQRPSDNHPQDYYSLYHFLEGLVNYDNWSSKINSSKIHKPLIKQASLFDSLNPSERFDHILKAFQESIIVISYGDPGKPTVAELKSILSKYKKNVECFDVEFSYKLNKKNGNNLREVILVGI